MTNLIFYFDGNCGFCKCFIDKFKCILKTKNISFIPIYEKIDEVCVFSASYPEKKYFGAEAVYYTLKLFSKYKIFPDLS